MTKIVCTRKEIFMDTVECLKEMPSERVIFKSGEHWETISF